MRTITNLLIFNLSLADLINTIFNSTFSYVFMKNRWSSNFHFYTTAWRPIEYNSLTFTFRNWIFGILFCRLSSFMTHLSIVASVLTMAAIAMERYFPLLVFQYPILGEINRKIILKCLVSKVWQISFRKYLSKGANLNTSQSLTGVKCISTRWGNFLG